MTYLLDTNILVIYIKGGLLRNFIETKFDPMGKGNYPLASVVTVGEIKAIAKRNNWGNLKLRILDDLLKDLIIADINSEDILDAYAEIDTFSQGKLAGKPLGVSARNMGKNDLWIAATAAVTGAKLLSADNDFDHLNGTFLDFEKIDLGIS
jgi:tRNA(fMet)-specific endonuclease VapC